MPDLHPGRICPIGAVVLTTDVLIPVLVDKDIGCGMTLVNLGDCRIRPDRLKNRISGSFFEWGGMPWEAETMVRLLADPLSWTKHLEAVFPESSTLTEQFLSHAYGVKAANLRL